MVLADRLIWSGLTLVLAACGAADGGTSQAQPDEADPHYRERVDDADNPVEVSLGSGVLSLEGCRVTFAPWSGPQVTRGVELPGSCQFALGEDRRPQMLTTSRGVTLLTMSQRSLPNSRFCDTRIRAVIVDRGQLLISTQEQRVRSCARGPQDPEMFHALALSVH